jgi:hypothetical protein
VVGHRTLDAAAEVRILDPQPQPPGRFVVAGRFLYTGIMQWFNQLPTSILPDVGYTMSRGARFKGRCAAMV